jgi:toxin ParE1/3/4
MGAVAQFAALARKDLLGIVRYIARDNPQRARSFVIELRQQCALLAEQPGLGVPKPELADGLRVKPHGRYLIFFSAIEGGILIERVLHSARNFSPLFDH